MMPSPEVNSFLGAMRLRDDPDEARVALRRHPHLINNPVDAAFLMHAAARGGKTKFVAVLHEFGVDVNIPRDPETPERPIGPAVSLDQTETVRWLIEHGSDINYGWDGELPSCVPLPTAIRNQNFEIVRLLVEAGADLLAKDRNNLTPLDWAVCQKDKTIADYLRSKGGKLSSELPGYVAPPTPDQHTAVRYADTVLGYSHPIPPTPALPEVVPVAVHGHMGDPCYLFTCGMSDRPMTAPSGGEEFQYAELILPLPAEQWPEDGDWTRDDCRWVFQWVRRVTQIPFENDTWLGGQWGVISNEEPPQPLSPFTAMTSWLLLARKEPLTQFSRDDGTTVVFYTMLPIHTDERDFVLKEGVVPLLQKFAEKNASECLEPGRPSVMQPDVVPEPSLPEIQESPQVASLQAATREFSRLLEANDAAEIDRFLSHHAEVISHPLAGARLLHAAAMVGNLPVVQLLLERGVDVDAPDPAGRPVPPILSAALLGHAAVVRCLIAAGATVNFAAYDGPACCLPLLFVIQARDAELARQLIDAGAALDARDQNGKTPLDWAVENGLDEIAHLIRSRGGREGGNPPS